MFRSAHIHGRQTTAEISLTLSGAKDILKFRDALCRRAIAAFYFWAQDNGFRLFSILSGGYGLISMAVVAIIPARYGSTRFPGKPLAKIGEKPMIQHVYESTS